MATEAQKIKIEEIAKKYGLELSVRKNFNQRQKEVYRNIYWCTKQCTGEFENVCMDYPKDSKEYREAYDFLHNKKEIEETVKCWSKDSLYGEGWSAGVTGDYMKHYRFCGNEWIDRVISFRVEVELDVYGMF